jgi:hypothetical protein
MSERGGSCAILRGRNDLRFIFQNLPGLIDCRLTIQPNRVVFACRLRGATDGDNFSEGVTMMIQECERRERMLRELWSDLGDLVRTGDISPIEAMEWYNRKADEWVNGT